MSSRALILDRDGVVNVEKAYVHRIEDFEFVDGIFDLCREAQRRGYLIIVTTNQSGIGRGYYTEQDFHLLTEWMTARFAERGVRIAAVYYAPDHPEHGIGAYKRESPDRKPNPGMLLKAQKDLDLDLGASLVIGDKASDIAAGRAAGVGTAVLFLASGTEMSEDIQADHVITALRDAVRLL